MSDDDRARIVAFMLKSGILAEDVRETAGYRALAELGMQDDAFEAVVMRYPQLFSAEAVARSRARMSEWRADA